MKTKKGEHIVKLEDVLKGITFKKEVKETPLKKSTEKTDSYVGCYADIDNDGKVDGIIYADMVVGNTKSGSWNNNSEVWSEGTKDRFYVMTLNDFTNNSKNTFYWYYNADNLDRVISKTEAYDFGKGKENTINMLNDWNNNTSTYGEQTTASSGKEYIDLWGAIQDGQYNLVQTTGDSKKWFVPSKGEWSAFGGELEITTNNYGNKGFSDCYWSSSQRSKSWAYNVFFNFGCMGYSNMLSNDYVRLSTTF